MIMEPVMHPSVRAAKDWIEAEDARVAALLRRDRVAHRTSDAKVKRPGENTQSYRARMAAMELTERPIGESLLTPEAERHAEYADAAIVDALGATTITKRNTTASSVQRMFDRGQLSQEQFDAAEEIAGIVEMIGRGVAIKGGGFEPRVDGSRTSKFLLIERLGRVRIEITYSKWRGQLSMPQRMFLDMVTTSRELVATARVYNVPWKRARKQLLASLDRWVDFRERICGEIDGEDLDYAQDWLNADAPVGPAPRLRDREAG